MCHHSRRSAFTGVMIREVKLLVPPVNTLDVMPAPRITSLAPDVVRLPLLAVDPFPVPDAVVSRGFTGSSPLYSATRTSANAAAAEN